MMLRAISGMKLLIESEAPAQTEIEPRPDGVYGWICVAACFNINCFKLWAAKNRLILFLYPLENDFNAKHGVVRRDHPAAQRLETGCHFLHLVATALLRAHASTSTPIFPSSF